MLNYSNFTEERLAELIADKDPGAFEYIYDKYSPALYGIIVKKMKFRKDADEILIDTFIQFFKAKSYKSPFTNSIFIDLYTIAINCISKNHVLYFNYSSADI